MDVLESFVRWKIPGEMALHRAEAAACEEWMKARGQFRGYTWAVSSSPSRSALYGICPFASGWPLRAVEQTRVIADPMLADSSLSRSDLLSADVSYYVALEIPSYFATKAHFAMLVDARDWYLLDEAVLPLSHNGGSSC